jgi:DsbC/DsbD-like thiol-disulfide interchange protein
VLHSEISTRVSVRAVSFALQCNMLCLPIAAAIVVASPNMSSGDDDARMTISMSAALTPAFCV